MKTAYAPALSATKADSNEDTGASGLREEGEKEEVAAWGGGGIGEIVAHIETIGLAEFDDSDSNDIDPFDDFDDFHFLNHQRSETSHNDDSV